MTQMSKGGNVALTSPLVRAVLFWSGGPDVPDVDASALLLGADGKVAADDDFVFYNQPAHPSGAVQHAGKTVDTISHDVLDIDLANLPAAVERVVLAASAESGTFGQVPNLRLTVSDLSTGAAIAEFAMSAADETAFVGGELYRRDGGWRFRAVGQGYATGLAGLAGDFGIDVGGETELEPDLDVVDEPAAVGPVLPPPSFTLPVEPPDPPVEPPAPPVEPPTPPVEPPAPPVEPPVEPPAPVDLPPPAIPPWAAPPAPPVIPVAPLPPAAPAAPTAPAAPIAPAPPTPPVAPPLPTPPAAPPGNWTAPPAAGDWPAPPAPSVPAPNVPTPSVPSPATVPAPPAMHAAPAPQHELTLDACPVALHRNQRVRLTSSAGGPLGRMIVNLGWVPGPGRREIDLDASCIAFDANGEKLEIVWYQHQNEFFGSLFHTGDNKTGSADDDGERLLVDLARLPAHVEALVFTINSFHGQVFTDLERAQCTITDENGRLLVQYDLTDTQPSTAVLVAIVRRTPQGSWLLRTIGEYHDYRTVKKLVDPAARQVRLP